MAMLVITRGYENCVRRDSHHIVMDDDKKPHINHGSQCLTMAHVLLALDLLVHIMRINEDNACRDMSNMSTLECAAAKSVC